MNLQDDIQPVSYLKSHTAHLLRQVNETHRPVIITQNGMARAVLQDPESYESMQNAFLILKLMAQGEADIRTGRHSDQGEVFERIRSRIQARKPTAEPV